MGIPEETNPSTQPRLFPKTKTTIDQDLRQLVERGLRRVRRVLSSRRAREDLVDVIEVVEDDREFGIVMLEPGAPLSGSPRTIAAKRQQCMTNGGRRIFWQNIAKVIEGLTYCHDAGIVHGAISENAIFSRDDLSPNYRLGGYESCVHIADEDIAPAGEMLRAAGPILFRRDLTDLAKGGNFGPWDRANGKSHSYKHRTSHVAQNGCSPPPFSTVRR